jgi:tryptophanyl-tRNA synthetase
VKRILTGDNTTGNLHLGHFVGSIKNRVRHQNEYETFIILADMHALAYPKYVTKDINLGEISLQVLKDNLACGLDPEKVYFFNESSVPEIYEIYTLFSSFVTHSQALRNPTIKEEIIDKNLGDTYSMGFLNFPTLMAADILAVQADLVPVGEDQKPMLELAREIVRKMNHEYATGLKFPEVEMSDIPRLVGLDGKVKMTKSLGNCIFLSDPSAIVREKIMKMYTDPTRLRATDPGKVEGNPVFTYHDAFNENYDEVDDLKERYLTGKVGDVEVKEKLFIAIEKVLEPIRERKSKFEDTDYLLQILHHGSKRTREEAQKTLKQIKESMNLLHFEDKHFELVEN